MRRSKCNYRSLLLLKLWRFNLFFKSVANPMEIIVILYRAKETFFNIKPCIVSFSVASLLIILIRKKKFLINMKRIIVFIWYCCFFLFQIGHIFVRRIFLGIEMEKMSTFYYFRMNLKFTFWSVDRFFPLYVESWPKGFPTLLLFMYCCSQTSMEVKNMELRREMRTEKDKMV